jgi:cyclic pyranopterin phosphate synthase
MDENALVDSYGRRIGTLRVSLTDHCNFRCVYCMPPEGLPTVSKSSYLTTAEITRFVSIAASLGVERCRLTGGEPLLRKEVIEITRSLKRVAGIREVSMTTNGSLLTRLAGPLREAGLDRLNISLDSLDEGRFEDISRSSQYGRVRDGIETAVRLGFPVKLNVVVMRGIPDEEIMEFVRMAVAYDMDIRFLEFMPLCGAGWEADRVYPVDEVRELVRARFDLTELPRADRPAETFSIGGGRGRVGFIASLSEPFCDTCSRMRLTADGSIRPCLFSSDEYPVGHLLKSGASDGQLLEAVRDAVWRKVAGNEFAEDPFRAGESARRETQTGSYIRSIGG